MPTPKIGPLGIATTKGDLYVVDANGDLERVPVGANGSRLVADSALAVGLGWSLAQSDIIPIPTTPGITAQAARADSTTLEGGMYQIIQPGSIDRFIFRVVTLAGAPTTTLSIGLYQAAGGGEGVASKIGTITNFAPAATGNQEVAFTEGTIAVVPGYLYVLLGRTSVGGSYSLRAYSNSAYDLLNQNMTAVNPRPLTFSTVILATALPATFDPSVTGAAVPSTNNTLPVIRMRHT